MLAVHDLPVMNDGSRPPPPSRACDDAPSLGQDRIAGVLRYKITPVFVRADTLESHTNVMRARASRAPACHFALPRHHSVSSRLVRRTRATPALHCGGPAPEGSATGSAHSSAPRATQYTAPSTPTPEQRNLALPQRLCAVVAKSAAAHASLRVDAGRAPSTAALT
jgi:hypothetical protein